MSESKVDASSSPHVVVLVDADVPVDDADLAAVRVGLMALSLRFALIVMPSGGSDEPLQRAEALGPLVVVTVGSRPALARRASQALAVPVIATLPAASSSAPGGAASAWIEEGATFTMAPSAKGAAMAAARIAALAAPDAKASVAGARAVAAASVAVSDAQLQSSLLAPAIAGATANCVVESDLAPVFAALEPGLSADQVVKYRGKVRDRYELPNCVVLVTTDRQTAFDRHLAAVPFKGHVLNTTSAWWFEHTRDIIANHVLACPDPNILVAKKCTVLPIEFVVRGYITGSTSTSMWTNYSKRGMRDYCGIKLPEGLVKNQRLWANLVTPTTKDDVHDELISPTEIVERKILSQADWDFCRDKALALFAHGQKVAAARGLILVDTKFEFGRDNETGEIILIDEILTPDSSRYWIASSYEERFAAGAEPENIDKEFLRKWFVANCDPYNDKDLPEAPKDLVCELSRRYIMLGALITGKAIDVTGDILKVEVSQRQRDGLAKAHKEQLGGKW